MKNTPKNIVVHHSVTPRDLDVAKTEKSIESNHKSRFNFISKMGSFVGYHYMIYGNGEVRQYREEAEVGAHCKEGEMNFTSIGICLIGDFGQGAGRLNEKPSDAQIKALESLVREIQEKYKIPDENVVPHRKYATYKDCYGSNLPDRVVDIFPKQKPLTDSEWCAKHLPDVDWAKVQPELQTAFRALAARVQWKK